MAGMVRIARGYLKRLIEKTHSTQLSASIAPHLSAGAAFGTDIWGAAAFPVGLPAWLEAQHDRQQW